MDKPHLKRRLLRADSAGVTAIEYGITASLVALVLLSMYRGFGVIFQGFGDSLTALFAHVGSAA